MKIVAKNRRATFDYAIENRFIAGIALSGQEVKSVKLGHMSLKGSFVRLHNGEAYLVNAHISAYKYAAGLADYEPTRSRKLLLHRNEVAEIQDAVSSQGRAAVALAAGIQRGLVKIEVGLGRGKKRYDKRELTKKRDMLREASQDIKHQ